MKQSRNHLPKQTIIKELTKAVNVYNNELDIAKSSTRIMDAQRAFFEALFNIAKKNNPGDKECIAKIGDIQTQIPYLLHSKGCIYGKNDLNKLIVMMLKKNINLWLVNAIKLIKKSPLNYMTALEWVPNDNFHTYYCILNSSLAFPSSTKPLCSQCGYAKKHGDCYALNSDFQQFNALIADLAYYLESKKRKLNKKAPITRLEFDSQNFGFDVFLSVI